MAPLAVIEIVDDVIIAHAPASPAAVPWNDAFEWKYVNYTPIVVFGVLLAITVWWYASAKNWFKGPRTTIDLPEGVVEEEDLV